MPLVRSGPQHGWENLNKNLYMLSRFGHPRPSPTRCDSLSRRAAAVNLEL
jgi:hypothetical protein